MAATVFWSDLAGDDIATLQNTFASSGVPTDPSTITCVITDPSGAITTYTYPATITKISTGLFQQQVACTLPGLWSFTWVGTGNVSDIQPGTWTVNPPELLSQFYTSVEEVKDRLAITDTVSDFQLITAVQAAARAIEGYTGRFFYQLAETRTFMPYSIWEQPIDDLVSITSLKVDNDGDGVFEVTWTKDVDYQLIVGPNEFNQMATGEKKPFTQVRVINAAGGGKFFPFTWPFSRLDRIQIIGTWGWPEVPFGVKQAAVQVATEFFKLKDSPFGLAGTSEFGVVRIPKSNPYIMKLLQPYISGRRRVGV